MNELSAEPSTLESNNPQATGNLEQQQAPSISPEPSAKKRLITGFTVNAKQLVVICSVCALAVLIVLFLPKGSPQTRPGSESSTEVGIPRPASLLPQPSPEDLPPAAIPTPEATPEPHIAKVTPMPTPRIDPTSTLTGMNTKTASYTNSAGFTVEFPTENKWKPECNDSFQSSTIAPTGFIKLYEDISSQAVYISPEFFTKRTTGTNKNASNPYDATVSTCVITPTTLNVLKNGYRADEQGNIDKPWSLEIRYKKIARPEDLQELVKTLYPECTAGTQSPSSQYPGVFDVRLHDKEGRSMEEREKQGVEWQPGDCSTNFAYRFLYAPKQQVAVLTSGTQDPWFSGTNEQSEPLFRFP